jgi:hypothetical protein
LNVHESGHIAYIIQDIQRHYVGRVVNIVSDSY